jgi:hypothetical protein
MIELTKSVLFVFAPFPIACMIIWALIVYTKTKQHKCFKYIRIILKILLVLILVFILFLVTLFSLWIYADTQRNKANEYIGSNDGFTAISSYKHDLYVTGGHIDGCGIYYPISEIYAFGIAGVPQDNGKALYWYS